MSELHGFRARRAIAIGAVLALCASFAALPAAGAAAAATDSKSRASVAAAYRSTYAPAVATPTGWTGSVNGCSAGTESAKSKRATLAAVNFARGLAGLSPVTLNAAWSKKALAAALVYRAQGDISHAIPSSWPCYTPAAASAGAMSNIALGYAGAAAVDAYLDDPGSANEIVGHRRFLLYPGLKSIGTGSTDSSNALYIADWFRTAKGYKNPAWVAWPTAGYFPQQLEPAGRWSFSSNVGASAGQQPSFASARVTVTSPSGAKLPVTILSRSDIGHGNDSIVFSVGGLARASGAGEKDYRVTVSGIKKPGSKKTASYSYTVRLFDPTAK
jgi:uncharacterized protein YkwD